MSAVEQEIRIEVRRAGPIPRLSPREELRLVECVRRRDPAAMARLIQASLPLISSIAHEYELSGVPLLHLVSRGQAGVMSALKCFDPASDSAFRAFAAPFIRRAIQQSLDRQVTAIAARVHPVTTRPAAARAIRMSGVEFIATRGSGMLQPKLAPDA